jgi:uncharacterized protein
MSNIKKKIKPKMRYYSLKLVLICFIVFIFQSIFPEITNFFLLNQDSFIQPYRFLTSIFLHGNIGHLFYNMFALALFGFILETNIKSKKFLIIFLGSGILSGLISINFYSASLGASGAIFGIIGTLLILKPLMPIWAFGMPMPMILASLLWVAGDLIGFFNPTTNVGHIAHLSGMFFGILFGITLRITKKLETKRKHEKSLHYITQLSVGK